MAIPAPVMLPRLAPSSKWDLVRFDVLVGTPTALRVLRREVGLGAFPRLLVGMARRSRRDPLRALDPSGWDPEREWLVRRQLRSVVLLHDVLRHDLGLADDRALDVLGSVVGETGARFVGDNVTLPAPADWAAAPASERRRYVDEVSARLFNAEIGDVTIEEERLGFDVEACRFAHHLVELGRPELGPLFCAADSVFFEADEVPVTLRRTGTIAAGASRCDFRFSL